MNTGFEYPRERLTRLFENDKEYPRCNCTTGIWCKHVDSAISSREDLVMPGNVVMVPVVPEQLLFAEVEISKSGSAFLVSSTGLVIDEIGFIGAGDTRVTLSEMIDQYLRDEYAKLRASRSKLKCISVHHGLSEEERFREMLSVASVSVKPEMFTLVCFQLCGVCYAKFIVAENNRISNNNYGLSAVTASGPPSHVAQKLSQKFSSAPNAPQISIPTWNQV